MDTPRVATVSRDTRHRFSKVVVDGIRLIEGIGVEGDAHAGATVQHLSRKRFTPTAPNLRQVHLLPFELFDELAADGFEVSPGDLGENLTTTGIDLLAPPEGSELAIGDAAVIRVTGLRNPCVQIDRFRAGLLKRVVGTDDAGTVVRRAGIMAVVVAGGDIRPGDTVLVRLPEGEHRPLQKV